MQSFEWIDASTVDEAVLLLQADAPGGRVVAKAGGVDLLDLMKEGILRPVRLVNLATIPALHGLDYDPASGLHLRALATLAQIAAHPQVRAHYPALAQAAEHAATPQLRNAATIGGNLLQRPRCWYFRNRHFHLAREATARDASQYGAIFDNDLTIMVHASTPATALIAHDATVHLAGNAGASRSIRLEDFLLPPDMDRASATQLRRAEVLTHISVPAPAPNTHAAYCKQTERDSYDWPICDVAVRLQRGDDGVLTGASIVLGWVAPVPRRARSSELALLGRPLTPALAAEAARLAVCDATPLPNNRYKVAVLESTVRRTLLAAAAALP